MTTLELVSVFYISHASLLRFLTATNSTMKYTAAAPPPQAVTLESDFVVILAALLCAVICVVGLLAVARCAWLRRAPGGGLTGPTGPAQASSSANKGLKKKVLQQLPKFTYGDGGSAAPPKMGTECAICLGEFAEGDEIRVLPQCGHVFHVGCIDTWLGTHSSCPSCRQILVVTRCHKCGNFPAIPEGEPKIRQDHIYHSAPPPLTSSAAAHSASVAVTATACCSSSSSCSDSKSNIFLP